MSWMRLFDEIENETGLKIEPCPFCGGEAVLTKNGTYWNPTYCVSCKTVDAWGNNACRGVKHADSFDPESPVEAIAKWNKRA